MVDYNGPANPVPPSYQYPQPYDNFEQNDPQPQQFTAGSLPTIRTKSWLSQALESVGLAGYGDATSSPSYTPPPAIPPWASPTFVPGVGDTQNEGYFQRVDRDPATYYMGQDPSNPSMPTSDLNDDMVFMGKYTTENVPQPHIGIPGETSPELAPEQQADAITVGAAMNLPYNWSAKHTAEVMKKMRAAGMNVKDFPSMMSGWKLLVERASRMFTLSNGQKEVTPWDVLGLVKKESKAAGLLDHNGNVVQTNVQRNVDDISEGEAWSAVRSAMSDLLGRKPSDQEVRDYASKLNAMAAKDPSITRTRTVTNQDTGRSHTTTNTTGGFNEQDAMQEITDDIENTDEYAQVQSATTYFNALLGALGETAPASG